MQQIAGDRLKMLGLGRYAQRFAENRRFIDRAHNGSAPKCPPSRSAGLDP